MNLLEISVLRSSKQATELRRHWQWRLRGAGEGEASPHLLQPPKFYPHRFLLVKYTDDVASAPGQRILAHHNAVPDWRTLPLEQDSVGQATAVSESVEMQSLVATGSPAHGTIELWSSRFASSCVDGTR